MQQAQQQQQRIVGSEAEYMDKTLPAGATQTDFHLKSSYCSAELREPSMRLVVVVVALVVFMFFVVVAGKNSQRCDNVCVILI